MNDRVPSDLRLPAAVAALKEGRIASRVLAEMHLARIAATDAAIEAWAHLDPAHVRAEADRCDAVPLAARGPLAGIAVGVKDIFATADLPTENGSPIFAGHRAAQDAEAVARLRRAGAYVFGKTVTTEFAYFQPGKTRNPWNARHTPGGSSSGSAAAVAAGQVLAAIGTQTNGSMIRPAAFCGVAGFKPTRGTIPYTGVFAFSPTLDQVGTYARDVAGAALLASVLAEPGLISATPAALARPPRLAVPRKLPVDDDRSRGHRGARQRRDAAAAGGRRDRRGRIPTAVARRASRAADDHAARGGDGTRDGAGARAQANVADAQRGARRGSRDAARRLRGGAPPARRRDRRVHSLARWIRRGALAAGARCGPGRSHVDRRSSLLLALVAHGLSGDLDSDRPRGERIAARDADRRRRSAPTIACSPSPRGARRGFRSPPCHETGQAPRVPAPPKPRNPVARSPLLRKGGAHGKTAAAKRRQAKIELARISRNPDEIE